jgi:branched-chain amino acid transport system substrate-binding protein
VSIDPASVTATTPLNDAQAGALATALLGPLKMVSGNTTRGISGHTITVAGISSETSNGQPGLEGMCDGAEARFARADRSGGVNGYMIHYLGCTDDGSNPQTAHQLLQSDVLQKKVFAVVPMSSAVTTAADGAFLNQNHVPYFGFGLSPAYCGWNSAAFAFSSMENVGCDATPGHEFLSAYTVATYDNYKKAANPSDIKWAFVGSNTPNTKAIMNALGAVAKALGQQVVYDGVPGPAPGAPALTSWDPVANQIISTGPTIVLDSLTGADSFSFLGALRAQGFKGDVEGVGFDAPGVMAVPALAQVVDGALATDAWVASNAYPGPSISQIDSDLAAIHSKQNASSFETLWGYQAADFFLDALSQVTGPLTTEALVNRINSGYTYPGMPNALGSSVWPQGHVTQSNDAGMEKVNSATKSGTAVEPFQQQGANYYVPSGS